MKDIYKTLEEFIDDLHNESIKETVVDLGILDEDCFKGGGMFINCIFHDGDNTPSLQITDSFWKCYACGVKGDIIEFVKLYYNTDFMDAIKKL